MGLRKLFHDLFIGRPCPGYEKEYREKVKALDVWSYSIGHKCKGILNGHSPKQIIEYYESIDKCICGYDKPKVIEIVGMGDFDITIKCPKCNRYITRSMYDHDVNKTFGWEELCVRDCNNGLSHGDIEETKKKEWDRIKLRQEDLKWKPMHPNNMSVNPPDGEYCLVIGRRGDSEPYGSKFAILFQEEEFEPMGTKSNAKIEYYILFMKRYYDIKGEMRYPEPRREIDPFEKIERTFTNLDINDYGEFVRHIKQ